MAVIEVRTGDLTRFQGDAIVNAANETLLGGGGVDGAIHRAAGPELLRACRALPELRPNVRCPTGEARITAGLALPARFVIHTVGPVWQGGTHREDELLAACYASCVKLAAQHGLRSLAFPAISCGVYGFPKERAAGIAVSTLRRELGHGSLVETVTLMAFDDAMGELLGRALRTVV